jgi:hypothetical protein
MLGVLAALCLLAGCEEKKTSESTAAAEDGGPGNTAAVDPSLAQAVAAASARTGTATTPQQKGGPPENGVFAPGQADRELAPNAPPKVSIGEAGADPKIDLSKMVPAAGWRRSGSIQLVIQSDPRQGALPVDFNLTIETQKPKAPAEGAQPAPAAPAGTQIVARITGAHVSARGGAGGDLDQALKKLVGSRIEYRALPSGGGADYRYDLAKGAEAGLGDLMRSLTEILATVSVPFPSQPIGAGGMFMATTRDSARGVDLVSYRLVKVERVSDSGVAVQLNTKRYATSTRFDMPGLRGADAMPLEKFTSVADGSLFFEQGVPVPESGEITLVLQAVLVPPDQPTQRASVQAQTRATINFEKAKPAPPSKAE